MKSSLSPVLLLTIVAIGCSSSGEDEPGPLSTGGRSAASGGNDAVSSGGVVATGGSASGGSDAVSSGGVAATGGSLTGGRESGGVSSTGGRVDGNGGVTATGGTASGGSNPSKGGSTTGGSTSTAGASNATTPVLPPITGDCPVFATGTLSVLGLSGISLQVGAKKQGTGSLLFYWHGTGSTASEVNALIPAAVRSEILAQGGVIVSFQGSLGTGGDCSGTSTFSKDDFKVADLIAACAVRDHGIDPRRIYTTGCSAGGLQAGCMGALRSSYIAATVPNSGGLVAKQPIQDASHTPSVMTMHGGTSDQVIVAFSQTSATYDAQMKSAGSFVVNCNHGGGHCQAPAALYTAGWQFMKDHPFGEKPEPYASGLPGTFPSYCAEY